MSELRKHMDCSHTHCLVGDKSPCMLFTTREPVTTGKVVALFGAIDDMLGEPTNTPRDDKELSIQRAHRASNIDGHGDEGAGYDYGVFAAELEKAGWRYNSDDEVEVRPR